MAHYPAQPQWQPPQPPQWQPQQMPMQYRPRPKKHHAWGVIIPLWIIASPIAAFILYIVIRFLIGVLIGV